MHAGSELAVITQEQLLAAILARFEYMWTAFESEGSFAPFADLYTKRWLHR
jgi:biotin--protein ligase